MEYILTFQEYNKALKKERLMVCTECAGTELEVVELSGEGHIVTFTNSYIAAEGRENEIPYTVVMVELEEGPWIMGNLVGVDPKKVTMDCMHKKVRLGSRVYPGDKYSDGDLARPAFSIVG